MAGLSLLSSNQYDPIVPFFAFHAHRTAHFHEPFISTVHIVVVIYSTIQVKVGLISEPNFVYPIWKTIHSFSYSVAHFRASLLVCVSELATCGDFVRKPSQILPQHTLDTCY